MKTQTKKLLLQLLFLVLALLIIWFIRNEFFISLLMVILLGISFKIEYHKNEWKLLLIGIVAGLVLEVGGDLVYKLQYWQTGVLMGIPLWVPLLWGYVFLFARRIGNIIVSNKK